MGAARVRTGRWAATVVTAPAGSGAAACSTAATSSTTTAPTAIDASRLVTAPDLGPGWHAPGVGGPVTLPCSAPVAASSVVGAHGSPVALSMPGSPTVVEYAGAAASPFPAYVTAIDVVRLDGAVVVVGYTGDGRLDPAALGRVATVAVHKPTG